MNFRETLVAIATLAAIGALVVACGGGGTQEVNSGVVIQNATIVNTRDGSLITGKSVVLQAGKIQSITDGPVQVTGTAVAIDATGKYVVPGFLDMHTHTIDAVDLPVTNFPLLIANGITGVREMRGSADLVQRVKKLNADSAAGVVDAPEVLLIPGEIFTGVPPASTVAAAATAQVQQQIAYGASFIKVLNVNREASLAVLAQAKAQGSTVAGHLSPALSAVESSNNGWRAIEHLGSGIGILLDCAGEEDAVRAALLRGEGGVTPPLPPTWGASPLSAPLYQRVLTSYDVSKCNAMAQTFAKNQTWVVPTLTRLRTQHYVSDSAYRTDPNLIYVSKSIRAAWEAAAVRFTTNTPASAVTTFRSYYALQESLPKLLKLNGVKLLAGSDTANIANWVIPGFSLHQEFALLAASGLSPLDILQMTTLNGAQFLNRETTMGTVETGKNADLVVLDANPIESAANLDKIFAVVLKGKYFSSAALAKLKSDVATAYSAQPAPTSAAVHALELAARDHTD